jgi:hypothetical protein
MRGPARWCSRPVRGPLQHPGSAGVVSLSQDMWGSSEVTSSGFSRPLRFRSATHSLGHVRPQSLQCYLRRYYLVPVDEFERYLGTARRVEA